MAGPSSVLMDDTFLSRLDGSLYRVERVFALISGIAVFALMLLAVFSVSSRNALQSPLPGYVDYIEQVMPLIAFMGISFCQRDGAHIRMDIVVGALRGRALFIVEFLTTLLILALVVLLIWGTWSHFQRSFDFAAPNWSRDSSIDIGIPIWPAKLLAPIAFFVLSLRLALQLWGYGRGIATGETVAVPMPLDVATQAQLEAQAMTEGKD